MTFTLPYAGATRIRFKGLPVFQALSLTLADTPSNDSTLNKALAPSQIRLPECLILELLTERRLQLPNGGRIIYPATANWSCSWRVNVLRRDDVDMETADAFDFTFDLVAGIEKHRRHAGEADA